MVPGIVCVVDVAALGRYLRGGSDEYWDMEGYDGAVVRGEAGADEGTDGAGGEDVEDDWGGLGGSTRCGEARG